MGRRKQNSPRHGSLAYLPRGRARSIAGRIRYWPNVVADSPQLLGFAGYKVGMSNRYSINDLRGSPSFGQEIDNSVTLIETPPMVVCGFRTYSQTVNGLQSMMEAWTESPPKELGRVFSLPKIYDTETSLKEIEGALPSVSELRALLITQPQMTGLSKKKPELFEVKVDGGDINSQFSYLKNLLGKEVKVSNVFKEGQPIDLVAITKGKGIQGPVKRWGVKTLPHKSRKTVRGVGTLGAWTPHFVMYTVPRAGQMGFHQRTEINRKILAIGKSSAETTPKGGYHKYGVVKTDYIVLKGSVIGPTKRLIKLRYASRPPRTLEVSSEAKQVEVLSSART